MLENRMNLSLFITVKEYFYKTCPFTLPLKLGFHNGPKIGLFIVMENSNLQNVEVSLLQALPS